MPETKGRTVESSRVFTYRNFLNKKIHKPEKVSTLTKEYHLERGDKNEVKVVADRPVDWVELANRDVGNVGLINVLKLVKNGQVDPLSLKTKDKECGDLSMVDPQDPNSIGQLMNSKDKSEKKLEKIASQLHCTKDELITSLMNGTFADLVEKAKAPKVEPKEGGNE